MKDTDRLKLRNNCRDLVANINVSDIQDYLYEQKVLNEDNLDSLINEKSQSKAARRLIVSILPRKGPEAYKVFCDALEECGSGYLVEMLNATEVGAEGSSEQGTALGTRKDTTNQQTASQPVKEYQKTNHHHASTVLGDAAASATNTEHHSEVIQRLARENTQLKKQLSFLGENRDRVDARTDCRRKSSGSRSSAHSISLDDHSHKGSDSGLSEVDSEELYPDEGADEIFDCADGGEILTPRFITTFCEEDEEEGVKTNNSNVFKVNILEASHGERLAELQEILAEDIVEYMTTPSGSRRNPQVFNKSQATYILALRSATDMMAKDHGAVFEQLSDPVDLAVTWREIHEQMKRLYDKFFEDRLQHDDPLWGKTVAICTLTGYVAKRCEQIQKVVLPLGQFLGKYLNRKLKRRIEKMGGWDAFCLKLQKKELTFTCIFPASLLQAAVTAPKRVASFSQAPRHVKSSSVSGEITTKTVQPRLLQRGTEKRQGSFLRTC